jgi:hypothetical protein
MKTFKYLRIELKKRRVTIVSKKFSDESALESFIRACNSFGKLDDEWYVALSDVKTEKR